MNDQADDLDNTDEISSPTRFPTKDWKLQRARRGSFG
jgi:hypothetical protein